jgi:hypothetical protein
VGSLEDRLVLMFQHPRPIRGGLRWVIRRFRLGTYESRRRIGAVPYPHYSFCVYQGASLGKRLGLSAVSVVEFGVAGGRGLLALEHHAKEISKVTGIDIEVYGFDSGKGLPKPLDYRDLPYVWREGFYAMDRKKLETRLTEAKLIIGDLSRTAEEFCKATHAPLAALMFDLDFYSSTAIALKMLEREERTYLPRVYCYFDDTIYDGLTAYNDYTGERLAIREFNQRHNDRKIAPLYLQGKWETWQQKLWVFHAFSHGRYGDFVGDSSLEQLPLSR